MPKEDPQEKTWIKPPELEKVVKEFESFYEGVYRSRKSRRPLIIQGDRGVGKTMFWKLFEVLYMKDHPDATIRRMNAAAIPPNLIESELFGYEKGAFTGAVRKKGGLIKDVDLLIMEEIGELPHFIQAKLLTVLEDGEYYPVGAVKPETNDKLQVLGTTNRRNDPETQPPAENPFRDDFIDRFAIFPIPPLYERRRDILYYIYRLFPELIKELSLEDCFILIAHHYPGNVRELEKICETIYWRKLYHEKGGGQLLWAALDHLSYDFQVSIGKEALSRTLFRGGRMSSAYQSQLMAKVIGEKIGPVEKVLESTYADMMTICQSQNVNLKDNKNLLRFDNIDLQSDGTPPHQGGESSPQREPDIFHMTYKEVALYIEKDIITPYLQEMMIQAKGKRAKAAKLAGVQYDTFCRFLKKSGLVES